MKYYKIKALQIKVECENVLNIPSKLGYSTFQELRDDKGIDELGIKEITQERYERRDDYYERY